VTKSLRNNIAATPILYTSIVKDSSQHQYRLLFQRQHKIPGMWAKAARFHSVEALSQIVKSPMIDEVNHISRPWSHASLIGWTRPHPLSVLFVLTDLNWSPCSPLVFNLTSHSLTVTPSTSLNNLLQFFWKKDAIASDHSHFRASRWAIFIPFNTRVSHSRKYRNQGIDIWTFTTRALRKHICLAWFASLTKSV